MGRHRPTAPLSGMDKAAEHFGDGLSQVGTQEPRDGVVYLYQWGRAPGHIAPGVQAGQ